MIAARCAYTSAAAVALLVLVQAVLVGRSSFGSWSITAHGVVGSATASFAVHQLTLAWSTRRTGSIRSIEAQGRGPR